MDVVFSKPWGDAPTKHLVAKIKALSFSSSLKSHHQEIPISGDKGVPVQLLLL